MAQKKIIVNLYGSLFRITRDALCSVLFRIGGCEDVDMADALEAAGGKFFGNIAHNLSDFLAEDAECLLEELRGHAHILRGD